MGNEKNTESGSNYDVREQADGRFHVIDTRTGEREPGLSYPNRAAAQADADA